MSFIKGGKSKSLVIEHCSDLYWGFLAIFAIVAVSMSVATGFYLKHYTKTRQDLGYDFDEFDII